MVAKEELLSSPVAAVTREGFGYDPERGELWFAGETAEAVLLELQARRRTLAAELDALRRRAEAPIPATSYSVEADPVVVRSAALAERVVRALEIPASRFETPLRARVDAGAARTGELGEELRRLGAAEVELRQALSEAAERASAIDVEAARIEAEADEARRRLADAGTDERADGDDRDELADKADRLERRRETLGQVNPLAKEEYDAEKVRLEELAAQRADLEQSLDELEKLRTELTETVERRFAETFGAVQQNFAEVAATLFPGGEGRLRLTEPRTRKRASPASKSSSGPRASACSGCRSSPAARRRSARSRSCSRSSSRDRARSTCSTRSRPRSTTRTSDASSSCCGATQTARSSSSSRTRSARWKPPTSCTA